MFFRCLTRIDSIASQLSALFDVIESEPGLVPDNYRIAADAAYIFGGVVLTPLPGRFLSFGKTFLTASFFRQG